MKIYVEADYKLQDILNISTIQQGLTNMEVELKDSVIDFAKIKGYVIESSESGEYSLTFDQEKYDSYLEEQKKDTAIKNGEILMETLKEEYVLNVASDDEAYVMRYMYDPWRKDTKYKIGDRRLYKDNLYKCKQDHTSQEQYTPDLVPALWDIINPDESNGTIDNPIVVPETVSSMIYVKGKYYLEGDTLYLMNRQGMNDGDEISLTYKPSQLVGHYFEVVASTEL